MSLNGLIDLSLYRTEEPGGKPETPMPDALAASPGMEDSAQSSQGLRLFSLMLTKRRFMGLFKPPFREVWLLCRGVERRRV